MHQNTLQHFQRGGGQVPPPMPAGPMVNNNDSLRRRVQWGGARDPITGCRDATGRRK